MAGKTDVDGIGASNSGTLICVDGRCSFRARPVGPKTKSRHLSMPSVTIVDHDTRMQLTSAPATPGGQDQDESIDGTQFWRQSDEIQERNLGKARIESPILTTFESQILQSDVDGIVTQQEESTRRISDAGSVHSMTDSSSNVPYHGETRKSVFLLVPPMMANKHGSTMSSGSGAALRGMASRRHIGPGRELEKVHYDN